MAKFTRSHVSFIRSFILIRGKKNGEIAAMPYGCIFLRQHLCNGSAMKIAEQYWNVARNEVLCRQFKGRSRSLQSYNIFFGTLSIYKHTTYTFSKAKKTISQRWVGKKSNLPLSICFHVYVGMYMYCSIIIYFYLYQRKLTTTHWRATAELIRLLLATILNHTIIVIECVC